MRLLPAMTTFFLLACAPEAAALDNPLHTAITAPAQQGTFDHSAFDALLKAHVQHGRVDYAGLRRQKPALEAYTATLAQADLAALSTDERLALLLNAYNAYTLVLMLEPDTLPASIKDLPTPWKQRRWTVGGHTVSLDDLEHGLIRPVFHDPRIHFAVNCASGGCPPLLSGAFHGATLDQQLEQVTRSTLQQPAYVRVEGHTLYLTKILDWYGSDLTAQDAKGRADTVAAYVARYATPEVAAFIHHHEGKPSVRFLPYDWSVNTQ